MDDETPTFSSDGDIPERNEEAAAHSGLCLTLDQWKTRKLPSRDFLLGDLFTTTSRIILSADTGLGKTHLGFAISFAIAAGRDFCHWPSRRRGRVLIIDGEMPRELVRERLMEAAERVGGLEEVGDRLLCLCKEDVPNMSPLDTIEGQEWGDNLIEQWGPIDFVVFDNIMALTAGDMKDDESWRPMARWMRRLTSRCIGQLWIHHTGHEASRSFGTKTREWQVDTVIIGTKAKPEPDGFSIQLKFSKTRLRTPENLDQFEPVIISLNNGAWDYRFTSVQKKKGPSPRGEKFHAALNKSISHLGKPVPGISGNPPGVNMDTWKRQLEQDGLLDPPELGDKLVGNRYRANFSKYKAELLEFNWIVIQEPWVWNTRKNVG